MTALENRFDPYNADRPLMLKCSCGADCIHHDPQYHRIRNHRVGFQVARSKDLSHGRAPAHPPVVEPGRMPEPMQPNSTPRMETPA